MVAPKKRLYKPPVYGPFLVVLLYLVLIGMPLLYFYIDKLEPEVREVVKEVEKEVIVEVPGPEVRIERIIRQPVPGPERVIERHIPYFIPVPVPPPPPPPEPELWSLPEEFDGGRIL
jgi:hypothetical protein